jgi:hypothetical protein
LLSTCTRHDDDQISAVKHAATFQFGWSLPTPPEPCCTTNKEAQETAGLCNGAYYVGYPPFILYVTFLVDFFSEDEYEFESAYYSEMEDAGYF